MPRVKIDYIVSFSSEDPENQAANLLSCTVGPRRWLCARGEPAASVVLQLARACTISSVTIGVHHAAFVEVLVGRSETPSEPYQVLVPSSVVVGPRESRGAAVERVRTFGAAELAAPARAQRWDRVRLVATQPYNKHCKYGISFVHMFEPEVASEGAGRALPAGLALPSEDEDEDEFRPGELFAQHRRSMAAADTGAQIRQATLQALRSDPEAATKLMKTPICRNKRDAGGARRPEAGAGGPRDKAELVYTADELRPHHRIDHVIQHHKTQKQNNDTKNTPSNHADKVPSNGQGPSTCEKLEKNIDRARTYSRKESDDNGKGALNQTDKHSKKSKDENKRGRKRESEQARPPGDAGDARPLSGVVFVLSGYQNPERARLRDLAQSLGARAQRDWGPACTHLICAFPNTPKMREVRGAPGGDAVPVARASWLTECARAARRVPWRPHATDPAERRAEPEPEPGPEPPSECDTDDEIDEVLRRNERRRAASPSRLGAAAGRGAARSDDDDVQFVKDERMQGNVTVESSDSCSTEPEEAAGAAGAASGALPALLAGLAFLVPERSAGPLDARLLARYARAYGGRLLTAAEAGSWAGPYYVLCGARGAEAAGGTALRADWLWACHRERRLLPTEDYLLSST